MNGWLIYDDISINRNKSYADMLICEAKKLNMNLSLISSSAVPTDFFPDFAISRSYDYTISKALETKGVRVFNSSEVSYICNDKYNTYSYFKDKNIPMMDTKIIKNTNLLPFEFPFVLKPTDGHGGDGVYLINNREEFESRFASLKNRNVIAQMLATEKGKDLRVYVIGNKILAGMMRISKEDFRSNFSLGGSAALHELTAAEKKLIKKVTDNLWFDYVGIDLIYNRNEPVLNEIEDVVGSRMLYQHTSLSTAALYTEYIKNELQ